MIKAPTAMTAGQESQAAAKPSYIPPSITTYTSDEILEQVGPALTGSQIPG